MHEVENVKKKSDIFLFYFSTRDRGTGNLLWHFLSFFIVSTGCGQHWIRQFSMSPLEGA